MASLLRIEAYDLANLAVQVWKHEALNLGITSTFQHGRRSCSFGIGQITPQGTKGRPTKARTAHQGRTKKARAAHRGRTHKGENSTPRKAQKSTQKEEPQRREQHTPFLGKSSAASFWPVCTGLHDWSCAKSAAVVNVSLVIYEKLRLHASGHSGRQQARESGESWDAISKAARREMSSLIMSPDNSLFPWQATATAVPPWTVLASTAAFFSSRRPHHWDLTV